MVCMANTKTVKQFLAGLEVNGCEVTLDMKAGTATATDDGVTVYKALQKGRGGPWMVRCIDSGRIKWGRPEVPKAVAVEA